MKSKIIASLILGIFLLVSFASAVDFSVPSSIELHKNNNSSSFEIKNNQEDENITVSFDSFELPTFTEGNKEASLLISPSSIVIENKGSKSFNVQLTGDFADFKFGEYTGILNVTGTNVSGPSEQTTKSINVNYISSFCKAGPVGNDLEITDVRINNLDGKDDDEWSLLNVIEVVVEVENNDNDEIEDVFVELGFFDNDGNNRVSRLDFENDDEEEIEIGDLDDGDSERVTFRFKVPADINDGDYKLAVKVYSDDLGEDEECDDNSSDLGETFYEKIKIELEDDEEKAIVIDDLSIQTEAICGESVFGSFTVHNIGEDDEDRVQVIIFNNELGIKIEEEITSGLDSGDSALVDFSFVVPKGVDVKNYVIQMKTYSDYRSNSDTYRVESDETWGANVKVVACSNSGGNGNILIAPTLQSQAKAGEEMVVRVSFTNIGNSESTYTVNARGYEGWASLDSVSQRIITLEGGESQAVEFTFTINKGVSGTNSFIIEAVSNGAVETREVEVNVDGGFSFNFGGSTLIWIIVAVNVLLIILIIIVAVRLSRR